jgi:hypothetical protein
MCHGRLEKGRVSRGIHDGIESYSHKAAVEANSVPTVDFMLDRDLWWILIVRNSQDGITHKEGTSMVIYVYAHRWGAPLVTRSGPSRNGDGLRALRGSRGLQATPGTRDIPSTALRIPCALEARQMSSNWGSSVIKWKGDDQREAPSRGRALARHGLMVKDDGHGTAQHELDCDAVVSFGSAL